MTAALTLPQGIELDMAAPDALAASLQDWSPEAAAHTGRRSHDGDGDLFTIPESLVGDVERERSFKKCIADVEGFRNLTPNWDTYGGLPAKEKPIQFSIGLLQKLQSQVDVSAPHVAPISTGVYIEWRNNDAILYFEVDEDSVLFVMKTLGLTVAEGEDSQFSVAPAVGHVKRFHELAP